MTINNTSQNLINLAVALTIAAVIWFLQPQHTLGPHGILLPSGLSTTANLPAISPDQVQVYDNPPNSYSLVGYVRTTIHFDDLSDAAMQRYNTIDINYAKQLAAQAGANGLWIQAAGRSEGGINPLDGFLVYAEAIHVSGNNGSQ